MRILLDTCVLAELRSSNCNAAVKFAVAQCADENLFLSVMTLGEISKGIALLEPGKKKNSLKSWMTGLNTQFAERIVPICSETSHLWGELTAKLQKTGIIIPAIDGLIAASAIRHGMCIMTRNSKHFKASGAIVIDPWQD